MSERFYLNWPLQLGAVTLEGPEAHHLATVCRLRPGDALCLFNGDGHEYPARVESVQRRSVQLEVLGRESPARELPFHLEIAAPLPKGDRAQFLVEKLTELGVTAFVPLSTTRSVVHPREAKLEKLRRYVIEASKQCGRNRLMEIREMIDWPSYVQGQQADISHWLGQPGSCGKLEQLVPSASNVVAVGPEGGFTDDEIAIAKSWKAIDLGPRILRIETAALAFATLLTMNR